MTDEGKKDTEAWIESKKVKYAYAYDKGGKLKSKLGVSGIPHAFLVNAQGKIVWEGHPGELTDKQIKQAVDGALPKPLFELSDKASALKAALAKRTYAAALAEAGKLSEADDGPALKAVVQSLIAGRVASVQSALKDGDFLNAFETATALKKELDGLPEAAEAEKALAEIKSNKEADKIMTAQKKVRAIGDTKVGKRAEFEKAIADLKKLSKEYEGTIVAKQADDMMGEIRTRRGDK